MHIIAVDQDSIPPYSMPDRFRVDIAYFMTPAGERGVPKLPPNEYWIHSEDIERWLADGVVEVVSPLDSLVRTEFEITEEQEEWLRWMSKNKIQRVRVGD
jgi:hypothetical protein